MCCCVFYRAKLSIDGHEIKSMKRYLDTIQRHNMLMFQGGEDTDFRLQALGQLLVQFGPGNGFDGR